MTVTNIRENLKQAIPEGGTARLTFNLKDDAGGAIPLAAIQTLRLWLYDEESVTILNTRTNVDILNANGGTVGATDGAASFRLTAADNLLYNPAKDTEWHVCFFRWTFNGGADIGEREIAFRVVALPFNP